jgi:hypothetical protein
MKKNSWLPGGILMMACLLAIGVSCKKDESTVPLPVTRAQLLARSWIQTDLLASLAGGSPTSVFSTVLQACERDNIWNFKSDGTYTVTEGATKCNATDPDTASSGTWQLTENDTKIIIDDINDVPQTFTITELTSSSLKITGTQIIQGSSVTGTAIFSPK